MAEEQNIVTVLVNGHKYSGWQSVSILTQLQSFARTFALQTTRTLNGEVLSLGIKAGDDVIVQIGKDVVLTGFVRSVTAAYSAKSVTITVAGASKTRALLDCPLPHGVPKSYKSL